MAQHLVSRHLAAAFVVLSGGAVSLLLHVVFRSFSSFFLSLHSFPLSMDDPNVAVAPDYTTNNFDEECQPFVDLGLTVQQAAEALKSLWTVHNNCDKALWQQKQQDTAAMQEAA